MVQLQFNSGQTSGLIPMKVTFLLHKLKTSKLLRLVIGRFIKLVKTFHSVTDSHITGEYFYATLALFIFAAITKQLFMEKLSLHYSGWIYFGV